jgi:hypothetical protein
MNGDYKYLEIAQRIVDRIIKCKAAEAGQITPDDLAELVGANSGDINCYPGAPNNKCCHEAFFISLTSGRYLSQRGRHLSFRKTLELFVQHMQGHCRGTTNVAVLIFDSWDPEAFGEWESNIEQIQSGSGHIEVFLITGNNVTPVTLSYGITVDF